MLRCNVKRGLGFFLSGVAALLLGACTVTLGQEEQKVNVDCVGTAESIDCTVKHTQGNSRVKACWELHYECANGETASGAGCQEVGPGETQVHKIPISELKNSENCDKVTKSEVRNLKLTAP